MVESAGTRGGICSPFSASTHNTSCAVQPVGKVLVDRPARLLPRTSVRAEKDHTSVTLLYAVRAGGLNHHARVHETYLDMTITETLIEAGGTVQFTFLQGTQCPCDDAATEVLCPLIYVTITAAR